MPYCVKCYSYDKEPYVKRYGDYYFCQKCWDVKKAEFAIVEERIGLEIAGYDSCYLPNKIRIGKQDYNIREVLNTLAHESLHHVILKLEGVEACYNFDRVAHPLALADQFMAYGIEVDNNDFTCSF